MGALVAAAGASHGDAVLTCVGPSSIRQRRPGPDQRPCSGTTSAWPTPTSLPFAGSSISRCSSATPRRASGTSRTTRSRCPREAWRRWKVADPGEILAYQYDVVCNGVELSSGAVRNHLPEVMEKAFAIAGYSHDRIERSFPALWNAFHYGPPPHAGIAPGVDRLLMMLDGPAQHPGGHRLPAQPDGPRPPDGGTGAGHAGSVGRTAPERGAPQEGLTPPNGVCPLGNASPTALSRREVT